MPLQRSFALGYRKGPKGGVWLARLKESNRRQEVTLGSADDALDSDGIRTLDYAQAQAKARDWSRRYHALIARRNEIDQKSAAAHPIHFNAVQSDPCLSPMGKDICTPPPPVQTQQMCSVNYGDTVGLVPCG